MAMASTDWPEAAKYINKNGGHPPSVFSKAFADGIPIEPGRTRFLDVGCGSGIIGLYCLIKKKAASVTFNEILDELMHVARSNVEDKVAQGQIDSRQVAFLASPFTEIPLDVVRRHTLLGFNPPQLPHKYLIDAGLDPVTTSFRDGGEDGLAMIREFFGWYSELPSEKPDAVIEVSSFLGWSRIEQALKENKIEWKQLNRTRVPLRWFMQKDAKTLGENATERADRSLQLGSNGQWTKELITILLMHESQ